MAHEFQVTYLSSEMKSHKECVGADSPAYTAEFPFVAIERKKYTPSDPGSKIIPSWKPLT